MKTADLQENQDYALQLSHGWTKRVRVLETGVSYKGIDSKSRSYRTKTMTGGVLVVELNDAGVPRVNETGKTAWLDGEPFEPGEAYTRVVRPNAIPHTWDEELRLRKLRAEREEAARAAKAERVSRREELAVRLNGYLPDDRAHQIRPDWDFDYRTGKLMLSVDQLEALVDAFAELESRIV